MIEAPETPHHVVEHHRTAMPWFDIAMAIAVLAVSFGSLFVSLHTGHTMERLVEQNQRLVRAQSTPILQYTHGNNDNGQRAFIFSIKNAGTGPARIAWVRIVSAGRTYRTWTEFALKSRPDIQTLSLGSSPIAPAVLAVGEERTVLRWPRLGSAAQLRAWDAMERTRFSARAEACYCSVFDECWISDMRGDVPRAVQSCENPQALARRHD